MAKNKICIIHPEGNINNNPNLTGIVEILCENGYIVDIYSLYREGISQKSPCKGASMIIQSNSSAKDRINNYQYKITRDYDLYIGIDEGILEASFMSNLTGKPYGLISYEIFFSDEIGSKEKELIKFKSSEIEACKNISFAVIQDEIRASFLSKENRIPKDKFIYIPVANRGIKKYQKNYFWYEKYNIPIDCKIALYMGSVDKWTMTDELIEVVPGLPKNWHLVIHCRSRIEDLGNCYTNISENNQNLHISQLVFGSFSEMEVAFYSADAGLAFYKPLGGPYTGKNLQYIGLSSGKISTYLQHGLPVISNIGNPMKDYFKKFSIGVYIKDICELKDVLCNWKEGYLNHENCQLFFREYLDLDKKIAPLLLKIDELISKSINGKRFLSKTVEKKDLNNEIKRGTVKNFFLKKAQKIIIIFAIMSKRFKNIFIHKNSWKN